jgi:hypothetical protein
MSSSYQTEPARIKMSAQEQVQVRWRAQAGSSTNLTGAVPRQKLIDNHDVAIFSKSACRD